jgi:hypothetical protein
MAKASAGISSQAADGDEVAKMRPLGCCVVQIANVLGKYGGDSNRLNATV